MKIGSLWKKEKDGQSYLSGIIKWPGVELNISIYKNEEKTGNQPDYHITWYGFSKKKTEEETVGKDIAF